MHGRGEGSCEKERGENQRFSSSCKKRDDHSHDDHHNGAGQGMSERVVQRQMCRWPEEKTERVGVRKSAAGECRQNNRPSAAREKSTNQREGQEYVREEVHS